MSQAAEITRDLVKASEVCDVKVKNAQGESLGAIEEIILDKVSGQVRYLVLSFGGFLGMGDKLFALPWNAIRYSEDEDCFILNIDKEILKKAPGFDKDAWPNFSDTTFGKKIFTYYGTKPYWE